MTKGEKRSNLGALVVPVADVETFTIDDGQVLSWPVVVGRGVFETAWERALSRVRKSVGAIRRFAKHKMKKCLGVRNTNRKFSTR